MEISSQGGRYDSFILSQPKHVASTAVLVKDPFAEVFANQLFPPEDSEEASILTDYKVQSIASLLIGKGRSTTALAMADGDRPSQFIQSFIKSSTFLTESQVSLLFGYQLLGIANPFNFIFTKHSQILMVIPPIYTALLPSTSLLTRCRIFSAPPTITFSSSSLLIDTSPCCGCTRMNTRCLMPNTLTLSHYTLIWPLPRRSRPTAESLLHRKLSHRMFRLEQNAEFLRHLQLQL